MRQIKFPEELDFSILPIPREYRNALARPNASIETDDIVFSLQSIEKKLGVNDSTDPFSIDYRTHALEDWRRAIGFRDLVDTPDSYNGYGGKFVAVKDDCSGLEFVTGAGGVTSFTDLDDTPSTYEFKNLFLARVNTMATGLEFVDGEGLFASSTHTHTAFSALTLTGFTENLLMTNASGVVGSPTNLSYSEVESYTDIPTWTEPYNNTYQIYDAVHGIYDYAYPATRYKIYAYKIIGGTKYFSDASAEFLVYGPD